MGDKTPPPGLKDNRKFRVSNSNGAAPAQAANAAPQAGK
jgi:hypothetical protein